MITLICRPDPSRKIKTFHSKYGPVRSRFFTPTAVPFRPATNWASQNNVSTPDWPCPYQFYEFGLKFLTRRSSCSNRHTGRLPFFFFSREIWPIQRAKKTEAIKARPKKTKTKRAGGQYLCTCGSNTGSKFQSKMIKIGRGIAIMPLLSVLLDLSIESSFGHIS